MAAINERSLPVSYSHSPGETTLPFPSASTPLNLNTPGSMSANEMKVKDRTSLDFKRSLPEENHLQLPDSSVPSPVLPTISMSSYSNPSTRLRLDKMPVQRRRSHPARLDLTPLVSSNLASPSPNSHGRISSSPQAASVEGFALLDPVDNSVVTAPSSTPIVTSTTTHRVVPSVNNNNLVPRANDNQSQDEGTTQPIGVTIGSICGVVIGLVGLAWLVIVLKWKYGKSGKSRSISSADNESQSEGNQEKEELSPGQGQGGSSDASVGMNILPRRPETMLISNPPTALPRIDEVDEAPSVSNISPSRRIEHIELTPQQIFASPGIPQRSASMATTFAGFIGREDSLILDPMMHSHLDGLEKGKATTKNNRYSQKSLDAFSLSTVDSATTLKRFLDSFPNPPTSPATIMAMLSAFESNHDGLASMLLDTHISSPSLNFDDLLFPQHQQQAPDNSSTIGIKSPSIDDDTGVFSSSANNSKVMINPAQSSSLDVSVKSEDTSFFFQPTLQGEGRSYLESRDRFGLSTSSLPSSKKRGLASRSNSDHDHSKPQGISSSNRSPSSASSKFLRRDDSSSVSLAELVAEWKEQRRRRDASYAYGGGGGTKEAAALFGGKKGITRSDRPLPPIPRNRIPSFERDGPITRLYQLNNSSLKVDDDESPRQEDRSTFLSPGGSGGGGGDSHEAKKKPFLEAYSNPNTPELRSLNSSKPKSISSHNKSLKYLTLDRALTATTSSNTFSDTMVKRTPSAISSPTACSVRSTDSDLGGAKVVFARRDVQYPGSRLSKTLKELGTQPPPDGGGGHEDDDDDGVSIYSKSSKRWS